MNNEENAAAAAVAEAAAAVPAADGTAEAIERLRVTVEGGFAALAEASALRQAAEREPFRLGRQAAAKHGELARIFGNED